MPQGPLAVRWGEWELGEARAGTASTARVTLENVGTVAWRNGIALSYHWLDDRGNPIVWDGVRTGLPAVEPGAEWAERIAAAHAEGFGVVAGSIAWEGSLGRRRPPELAPYETGPGRIPGFSHPLLCPSVMDGVVLERLPDVAGLPAFGAPLEEPWLYDGRITLRALVRRRR